MLLIIANFTLGLFLGVLALASFAPVPLARPTYRTSWFFWILFVLAAFWAKNNPPKLTNVAPETSTLIITVISGIVIAFIGGMLLTRRLNQNLKEST